MSFQSPSLRGSGRFGGARRKRWKRFSCFNPLHCGAVVASHARRMAGGGARGAFQFPSLRGSGRFILHAHSPHGGGQVSIPFIAGQWSLPGAGREASRGADRVSIPFIAGQWSLRVVTEYGGDYLITGFNPLHCGAVVASAPSRRTAGGQGEVSIPFIAGQWSLRYIIYNQEVHRIGVSIPFIAGQWSLP